LSGKKLTMPRLASHVRELIRETRRRSVFKVATVYAVTAWGASVGAAELRPAFGAPEPVLRLDVRASSKAATVTSSRLNLPAR